MIAQNSKCPMVDDVHNCVFGRMSPCGDFCTCKRFGGKFDHPCPRYVNGRTVKEIKG